MPVAIARRSMWMAAAAAVGFVVFGAMFAGVAGADDPPGGAAIENVSFVLGENAATSVDADRRAGAELEDDETSGDRRTLALVAGGLAAMVGAGLLRFLIAAAKD